jgi:DNA-binding response OmpR family regulator
VQRLRRDGKERIAAILVNLFLPDSHGLETFDRLFETAPDVPILVLSSPGHEHAAKLALKRGAQDYLLEDHLLSYLLPKALSICSSARRARKPYSEGKSAHK